MSDSLTPAKPSFADDNLQAKRIDPRRKQGTKLSKAQSTKATDIRVLCEEIAYPRDMGKGIGETVSLVGLKNIVPQVERDTGQWFKILSI